MWDLSASFLREERVSMDPDPIIIIVDPKGF